MAEEAATTETTEATEHKGGFPPFDTTTFPSQIFWLVITFAFLFVVLWRVAGPRIQGAITLRRSTINAAIDAATRARGEADAASAAYQTALAGARARANALAEETRQSMNAEIVKAKAEADQEAHQEQRKAAAAEAHRVAERLTAAQAERDQAAKAAAQAREEAARLAGQLDTLKEQSAALLARITPPVADAKPAAKKKGSE